MNHHFLLQYKFLCLASANKRVLVQQSFTITDLHVKRPGTSEQHISTNHPPMASVMRPRLPARVYTSMGLNHRMSSGSWNINFTVERFLCTRTGYPVKSGSGDKITKWGQKISSSSSIVQHAWTSHYHSLLRSKYSFI